MNRDSANTPVRAAPVFPAARRLAGILALGSVATAAGESPLLAFARPAARLPEKGTPIEHVTFVAFDTETTGFSPREDRIVELGAVRFRDGEIVEQRSWLVNPQRKIPYWARRVHGIDDAMVEDQPRFKEVYPEFTEFIEGSVLIAHNARFDISFIVEETRRAGFNPPPNEVIDSLPLFKKWFPGSDSYSLEALAEHLEIRKHEFHRAVADAMCIYWILHEGLGQGKRAKTLGALEKSAGGPLRF